MITKAVVYVDDEACVDINSQQLDLVMDEEDDETCPGLGIDVLRSALYEAFSTIFQGHSVDIIFPEMDE